MNIFLQFGIGFAPAVIVVWLLLVKRKAFRAGPLVCAALLTAVCGGLSGYGALNAGTVEAYENKLGKDETIALANAFAYNGAYDQAMETIGQYSKEYSYDGECSLLTARLYALSGDLERACGIYQRLSGIQDFADRIKNEFQLVKAKFGFNASDAGMSAYLEENGRNPEDYGYSSVSSADSGSVPSQEDIEAAICKSIAEDFEQAEKDGDISECAEYVAEAEKLYSAYGSGNAPDSSEISRLSKRFEKLEEQKEELFSLKSVRLARLKTNALSGDFDKIAEALDGGATYDELMIASELYMNGTVDEKDFPAGYLIADKKDAESVKEQLDKIYDRYTEDMSKQEKKALQKRINSVEAQTEEPVLSRLKNELEQRAENEAGTDRSKVYLEIAKINDYFGNETASDENINQAIYNSQDCGDDNYAKPMSQIISVINNDSAEESENIKNVTQYVDEVIDNSQTINVSGILDPGGTASDGDSQEENSVGESFSRTMTDYVSKIKSAVNIGKINTNSFETVTARVQIASAYSDSAEALKSKLSVADCGLDIEDFEIRKIEYSGSNILLLCDVSGSMGGSMDDLKNAVKTFIDDKNPNERLSLATFDDAVQSSYPFGTSDEELKEAADEMYSMGGTNMFSALKDRLDGFEADSGANNIVILMTDGCDNNPRDYSEIVSELGSVCLRKGITVYTLGLGSEVDTEYLNNIANACSGDFVYVSDSSSLNSFYDMLHGQLANQYEITYTAVDTLTMSDRTLEVSLADENVRDAKLYSLVSDSGDDETDGDGDPVSVCSGISVSGLNVKYIYKGLGEVDARLVGTGFKEEYSAKLKLNGNLDYDIPLTFKDQNTYELTIPASIAVGTYDVEITVNGKKAVISQGFSVIVQGSEKKTEFGPYVFTSVQKTDNGDGSVTLSGAVKMNGWLNFKGDVRISGNTEQDGSVYVTDYKGSYISFDKAVAQGLGKSFAELGIGFELPALGEFKLYNDQSGRYDYSDYTVDDIRIGILKIYQLVSVTSPAVRLYPNQIVLAYSNGKTVLPYQDNIFKDKDGDLFKFNFEGKGVISDRNIGIILKTGFDDGNENYSQYNMFGAPVYLDMNKFKVDIDTIENNYAIGAMVKIAFLDTGVGADLEWKDWTLDSFVLHLDKSFKGQWGPVPVTYSDFSLGAKDIKEAVESNSFAKIKLAGSLSIACGKVSDYFPELESFVGDVSLLELPDTSFEAGVSPFSFNAKAKLTFLKEIELMNAEINLGTFNYTNTMLGLDSAEVSGLNAKLSAGLKWNVDNASLEITGTGELDAHSRFIGVMFTGTGKFDIKWWLFSAEYKNEGSVVFGCYFKNNGDPELVLGIKSQDSGGKTSGKVYYIDKNGKCGSTKGSLG
ncbi:vWA domain-containing protein [Ruminococcus sp. Marseille-P6503]|uniref:vWA domain-containing protein n=1 Tax=Ruminococcus sp. Marseille-P6503 TaxID=2364796 RepID=UPI000F5281E9|nr:vWA domain-containing protein [Ruminococcus sp. Marseille-P6503]